MHIYVKGGNAIQSTGPSALTFFVPNQYIIIYFFEITLGEVTAIILKPLKLILHAQLPFCSSVY